MCGRFALTAPASTITEIFQVDVLPDILPRYNVAPTTQVLCVAEEEGARVAKTFRWGLVPFWAKDIKIGYKMINARSETVASKPAFRAAFKKRRLLILSDGFYEWKRLDSKNKIPHQIGMKDNKPFAMAGIWERWTDPESGDDVHTCAIITVGPNSLMEPIHNRMPVILPPSQWGLWLDPAVQDKAQLQELLVPFPADEMAARRVSSKVGNVRNQGADVQDPWEGE